MTRFQEKNWSLSGRLKRRAHPIIGYFGGNGSGKSAVACLDLMAALDAGYPVLSTVRLLDYTRPRPCPGGSRCDDPAGHERPITRPELHPYDDDDPDGPKKIVQVPTGEYETHRAAHPGYVRWTTYQQFMEFQDGEVFGDEVTSWASSRESSKLPAPVLNKMQQLRKANLSLRYTTPNFSRTDLGLREITRAAVIMRSMLPRAARIQPGRPPSLWKERRLFIAKTYDAMDMDEFDARRLGEEVRPLTRSMYWGPGSRFFDSYDTYDSVSQLGWSDAGTCIGCGGKRRQEPCRCADHGSVKRDPADPASDWVPAEHSSPSAGGGGVLPPPPDDGAACEAPVHVPRPRRRAAGQGSVRGTRTRGAALDAHTTDSAVALARPARARAGRRVEQ